MYQSKEICDGYGFLIGAPRDYGIITPQILKRKKMLCAAGQTLDAAPATHKLRLACRSSNLNGYNVNFVYFLTHIV